MLLLGGGPISHPYETLNSKNCSREFRSSKELKNTNEPNDNEPYEVHPLFGALPPQASNDQPVAMSSSPEPDEVIHPKYGLLPSNVYAQQESGLKDEEMMYDSGSGSELGGQGQPTSMLSSSHADTSYSYPRSTASSLTSISSEQKDSVEIQKLEATVKDLTMRLKEALSEVKKKDDRIMALQQLLEEKSVRSLQNTDPVHPKLNGSDSQMFASVSSSPYVYSYSHSSSTAVGVSPRPVHRDFRKKSQGWPERQKELSANNFINRSKSSSPAASESVV